MIVTETEVYPHPGRLQHVCHLLGLEQANPLTEVSPPCPTDAFADIPPVGRHRARHPHRRSSELERLLRHQLAPNGSRVQEVDHEPAARTHGGDHLPERSGVLRILLEISKSW